MSPDTPETRGHMIAKAKIIKPNKPTAIIVFVVLSILPP